MRRIIVIAGVLALLPTAGRAVVRTHDAPSGSAGMQVAADPRNEAADQRGYDADNTGRNVRDREGRAPTPMDQGGSDSDRTITAEIRKSVVSNDGLSTNAHNVKIITVDGVVTLRGPVKSNDEKAAIASAAQKTPGVKRVDNQLEIERR